MPREERKRTAAGGKTGRRPQGNSRQGGEKHRPKAVPVSPPDELGIIHGQNGELGNTVEPRNVQHEGDVAH